MWTLSLSALQKNGRRRDGRRIGIWHLSGFMRQAQRQRPNISNGLDDRWSNDALALSYARAREGVTRKQQESEPEPSVTEPLLLTVATDCGDESRGVRVDCAAHAVAKDSRSRALIRRQKGRPRRRCATRALNLSPSLSGPLTSGEGRLQVHFAQWGEAVGGTRSQ